MRAPIFVGGKGSNRTYQSRRKCGLTPFVEQQGQIIEDYVEADLFAKKWPSELWNNRRSKFSKVAEAIRDCGCEGAE